MSIALEQFEELRRMEGEVQQRPNGPRVLRLLQELSFIEGKLANSLHHAGDFPGVTVVLATLAGLVALALASLSPAQEMPAVITPDTVVEISAEQQALSMRQVQAYMSWLGQAHAHAHAAAHGDAAASEAF